jgi:hypothetical protein
MIAWAMEYCLASCSVMMFLISPANHNDDFARDPFGRVDVCDGAEENLLLMLDDYLFRVGFYKSEVFILVYAPYGVWFRTRLLRFKQFFRFCFETNANSIRADVHFGNGALLLSFSYSSFEISRKNVFSQAAQTT